MAQSKVKALKSWGSVRAGDEFELEEQQARRWAHKSRVKILGPAEPSEEDDAPNPKKRETKPEGPSETKPEGPEKTKDEADEEGDKPKLEKVESGPGWFHVLVDGEPVPKPDGQPKNFREDEADEFIAEHS